MIQVNPRVGVAFKKLFGMEENKDLLISLINSIVSDEDQVKDVTWLNLKNFKNDNLSPLDIRAQRYDEGKFNIEIQITDMDDYDNKALGAWAKLYQEKLASGESYSNVNKAIGIHILNFTFYIFRIHKIS